VLPIIVGEQPMSETGLAAAIVGRYGLHAALGLILALFAGFLYIFNFTSFF
jgi:hypothetical protein